MIKPTTLFKSLADDTRLKIVLLIYAEKSLCVCELTRALGLSQPTISRHLAQLRSNGLLTGERVGKWVFYSLSQQLLAWHQQTIALCFEENHQYIANEYQNLTLLGDRPNRQQICC